MALVEFLTGGRRLWLLPIVFSLAIAWMLLLVQHAPNLQQLDSRSVRAQLKFPSSLAELRRVSVILGVYNTEHWHYTLLLFCSAYLFKQSFSIPGSVFLNMLAGALYGPLAGCLLSCCLATAGASLCYQLSLSCCRQLLVQLLDTRIQQLTARVNSNRSQLFYFLLFMRLFPMTPNWFLNVASPIAGVPLKLFVLSVFIGLMPYHLVCSQAGSLMGSLNSIDELFSGRTLVKMALLSLAALLPSIYHRLHTAQATPCWHMRVHSSGK